MLISLFFAFLSHIICWQTWKKWQYFRHICDKFATKMKIPTPRKRGETYTITVSFESKRYYCARDTAKECEQWAHRCLIRLQRIKMDIHKLIMN